MTSTDTQFKAGHKSWNTGKNISGMSGKKQSAKFKAMLAERNKNDNPAKRPEVKEKMRLAKLGKKRQPHTAETKEKISKSNSGKIGLRAENHPRWKGGVTSASKSERNKFRETKQHIIFARDKYTCQICLQAGGNLQVDHIKPWADYPSLRFNEKNCRTLCMSCHYYITFKKKMPKGVVWGHNLNKRVTS